MGLFISDAKLRGMYTGGRADRTARRFARFWAAVLGSGLAPRRWVTLEVTGRFPVFRVEYPPRPRLRRLPRLRRGRNAQANASGTRRIWGTSLSGDGPS